jgi:hypothetical protein
MSVVKKFLKTTGSNFQKLWRQIFHRRRRAPGAAGAGAAAPAVFFGAPLEEACLDSHPFAQLVWFLRNYGGQAHGLFRVPGEQVVVDDLCGAWERRDRVHACVERVQCEWEGVHGHGCLCVRVREVWIWRWR